MSPAALIGMHLIRVVVSELGTYHFAITEVPEVWQPY